MKGSALSTTCNRLAAHPGGEQPALPQMSGVLRLRHAWPIASLTLALSMPALADTTATSMLHLPPLPSDGDDMRVYAGFSLGAVALLAITESLRGKQPRFDLAKSIGIVLGIVGAYLLIRSVWTS